jgi:rare lipoprotein A
MQFRLAIGSSVAVMVLFSGAMADQMPAPVAPGEKTIPARRAPAGTPLADTIAQIADVTQQSAQFASTALVSPPTIETTGPADISTPAPTKVPADSTKSTSTSGKSPAAKATQPAARDKLAGKSEKHADGHALREQLVTAEPTLVRAIGKSQTGTAAWYGGTYIGRRTTSGDRLDTIHATAAHRSLPLNSLARVTNLQNGRSVVVRVTDRGPVAEALLIDMSPRAADELRMKEAGLVPVTVEQVVEVPPSTK